MQIGCRFALTDPLRREMAWFQLSRQLYSKTGLHVAAETAAVASVTCIEVGDLAVQGVVKAEYQLPPFGAVCRSQRMYVYRLHCVKEPL